MGMQGTTVAWVFVLKPRLRPMTVALCRSQLSLATLARLRGAHPLASLARLRGQAGPPRVRPPVSARLIRPFSP